MPPAGGLTSDPLYVPDGQITFRLGFHAGFRLPLILAGSSVNIPTPRNASRECPLSNAEPSPTSVTNRNKGKASTANRIALNYDLRTSFGNMSACVQPHALHAKIF
jgi:hypothetical protein